MQANDFLELINTRRSVRRYQPRPVPQELLDEVLRAGSFAPSGMNRQPCVAVVFTGEARDRLAQLNAAVMGTDGDPFYGAPVVVAVLADKTAPTYLYDGSLVMGNLLLAAHAVGLGSCWIHRAKEVFESRQGKEILAGLGLDPEQYEGVGNCILGYADGPEPQAKPRREKSVYFVDK